MILSAVPNFPIAVSFEMDNILYVTRLSSSYRWVLSKLKKKLLYLICSFTVVTSHSWSLMFVNPHLDNSELIAHLWTVTPLKSPSGEAIWTLWTKVWVLGSSGSTNRPLILNYLIRSPNGRIHPKIDIIISFFFFFFWDKIL